jgi:DNA-binding LacI/PurR family transcriptional regulator
MIDSIPRRQSLVSQTAMILREEIRKGEWRDWLPGERALCEALQVSRNTLRAALAQLKRDGVIRSDHGAGNRILLRPARRSGTLRSHDVALLSPEALERLRPSQTLWIDELRAMLSERGCRLHVFHGPQYYRANPAAALEKLVAQHPHGCWVLALSNEPIQRWFERRSVPCVVAGSVYAGLNLPFRDLDHRAICRHAAGVMLGQGHRKVALLIQKSRRAGDLESEAGFIEGVRGSPHTDAEAAVCYHDSTVSGICQALRRQMDQASRPTALLVANAYYYLTVTGRLAQAGWRVPQDISVVSRDEDPFLSFVVPTPARYIASPHTMARTLLRPVLELLEGGVVTHRTIRIMPDFIRGETLAAPPQP